MHKQVLNNPPNPIQAQNTPVFSSSNQTVQAKQKPIQAKQKPIQAKQKPIQAKQTLIQAKQKPVQRHTKGGKGTAKFQEIAATMGEQHSVDTSTLKATHNSSFPDTVNAEATIQGSNIDFAPGKDTEFNMKHEVAHYIDNTKNGTPKGDAVVNGQAVDTTREQIVDQMANEPLQRKTDSSSEGKTMTSSEGQVVQRVKHLEDQGSDSMTQQAGTCGMYALANAIAVAHNRLADAEYRTAVKDKLLRVAGEQDALTTGQGELVSYGDIETLITAYNADQTNEPLDQVRLVRRAAPKNDNAQSWRNAVGRSTNRTLGDRAVGGGHKSEEEVNEEQVGAVIAVDYNMLSSYNSDLHDKRHPVPVATDASGAHLMTIAGIEGEEIILHNSQTDAEERYPIWAVQRATKHLKNVSKRSYLQDVYDGTKKNLKGHVENNAGGFIESNMRDWRNPEANYPAQTNRDYETMSGEANLQNQYNTMAGRMERTQGPGAHNVRLRNLIIRVEPA